MKNLEIHIMVSYQQLNHLPCAYH